MKILVLVKQVPEVADAELAVAGDGRSIVSDDLSHDLGEWDACAVEAAVRIKERHDAEVTVVTAGEPNADASLRKALAMGADRAARIDIDAGQLDDPLAVARLLAAFAARQPSDLILTGVMAADDGHGAVGPALGHLLGVPHATMIVDLVLDGSGSFAVATRELEEGLLEKIEVPLPAVIAAQTGLAEPRYVSVIGIRKTRSIPIETISPSELDGHAAPRLILHSLAIPPSSKQAEMLDGSPGELATRICALIEEVAG